MTEPEKKLFRFLLLVDSAGILVSMVAGPLRGKRGAAGRNPSPSRFGFCIGYRKEILPSFAEDGQTPASAPLPGFPQRILGR